MWGLAIRLAGLAAVAYLASCKGTEGEEGGVGSQGTRGPSGPKGPQGPKGDKGDKGGSCSVNPDTYTLACQDGSSAYVRGAIGPAGPQGMQGLIGSTGLQGPQGAMGPQGNTGQQGLQGLQGIQGNAGPQGIVDPSTCQITYKYYQGDGGYSGPGYTQMEYQSKCDSNQFLLGGGCMVGSTATVGGTHPAIVDTMSFPVPASGSPMTNTPFSLVGAGWNCGATVMSSSATFYIYLWRNCCNTP